MVFPPENLSDDTLADFEARAKDYSRKKVRRAKRRTDARLITPHFSLRP